MKTERTLAEKPKGERPKQPACPSPGIQSGISTVNGQDNRDSDGGPNRSDDSTSNAGQGQPHSSADEPSPEDEAADLKTLRIGCLSIFLAIVVLYLVWILSEIAKGADNMYVHQSRRYLLLPVTWPAYLGGFFVDRTFSRLAAMAGWSAFMFLVVRLFTATTLRSFRKAAFLFALLFLASLAGCVGAELNRFNAGFN